eukprot:COSAG01_NODE_61280_length_290_cov_0.968586_1_plen_39_part_01
MLCAALEAPAATAHRPPYCGTPIVHRIATTATAARDSAG